MSAFKRFGPPRNKRGPITFYCPQCHQQVPQNVVRHAADGEPYHYRRAERHAVLMLPTHPSEV